MGHLWDVAQFTTRLVGFKDGVPMREAVTPYWRYYCECGVVGGKVSTEDAARAGHARHVEDAS